MLKLRSSRRSTTASRRRLTYISPAAVGLLLRGVSGSEVSTPPPVDWSKFANERDDERITQQQQDVVKDDTSGDEAMLTATTTGSKNNTSLRQQRSLASPTPPVAALSTPPPTHLQLRYKGNDWERGFPLNECEGDCDEDDDCIGDLICIQRSTNSYKAVPGCLGGETNSWGTDYCARPDAAIVTANPTTEPTVPPTISPAPTPAYPRLMKIGNNWNNSGFPLNECEGDCDRNRDCKGNLICFQREGTELVPGCIGGESESPRTDYCVRPEATIVTARPTTAPPTISPAPTLKPTTASPTKYPTPVPTPIPTPIPTKNPSGLKDYKNVGREKNLGECEGDCDRNVSGESLQNGLTRVSFAVLWTIDNMMLLNYFSPLSILPNH